jgi:hypothetical protein
MSAPHFNILTQKELTIDLSRPAMELILECTSGTVPWRSYDVQCELDNFRNTLLNLLERSEPKNLETVKPENLDLIGG